MSKKEFTYDNGKLGERSTVSRIDKFLVSQEIEERGGKIEATTSVRKLTDHLLLVITVWEQHPPPPRNPLRFFDVSLLNNVKGKREMLEAWASDQPHPANNRDWPAWLEKAVRRVMCCNTRLAKEKKRVQGACVRTCKKNLN
jgi:hypothetical protein